MVSRTFPHPTPAGSSLGLHKKLGGDAARTGKIQIVNNLNHNVFVKTEQWSSSAIGYKRTNQ